MPGQTSLGQRVPNQTLGIAGVMPKPWDHQKVHRKTSRKRMEVGKVSQRKCLEGAAATDIKEPTKRIHRILEIRDGAQISTISRLTASVQLCLRRLSRNCPPQSSGPFLVEPTTYSAWSSGIWRGTSRWACPAGRCWFMMLPPAAA